MAGLVAQTTKHFRDVFFGGNWTSVSFKETVTGIGWQQATQFVPGCNSIAVLVFHINYYVSAVLKVLQGGPLEASDKFSFDLAPIQEQADWDGLVSKALNEAEQFAVLLEQFSEEKLLGDFIESKYGTYYRNVHGIIEHTHYHLGQISLLKKMTMPASNATIEA